MVSSQVFLPDGRSVIYFSKFKNVYPKVIIFCGKRHNFNVAMGYSNMIVAVHDDTYYVKEEIEKLELDLEKKQNIHN